MNSNFLKLNFVDVLKGLIVAILTAILGAVYAILSAGGLPTMQDAKTIGISCLWAGIAYLLKNIFTNSDWQPFTTEQK